jgi:hypothetical protein
MTYLQVLPPDQIPVPQSVRELVLLAGVVFLGIVWMVAKSIIRDRETANERALLADNQRRIIETQKEIKETNKQVAAVLENHLGEIGRHMAAQTELSRLILEEHRGDGPH